MQVSASINYAQGGPSFMVRDSSLHIGREFRHNSLLYFGSCDISLSVETHSWATLFNNRFGFLFPLPISEIRNIFDDHDILIIHGYYLFSTLLSVGLWRKKVLYIMPHGSLEPYQEGFSRLRKKVFRSLFNFLAGSKNVIFLVASSREITGVKSVYPNHSVYLAGYGVEKPQKEIESTFDESNNSILLGFLGRIHPIKRIDLIINALPKTESLGLDVNLIIGGAGEEKLTKQLACIATNLGVENRVKFLGNVNLLEKDEFFKNIDVLILLSENENFALVIAEAITRNIPTIVRSTIAMSDFVTDFHTGIVVNSASEEEVSMAISEIHKNYRFYVENCKQSKQSLSWDAVSKNWVKILTSDSSPA